MVKLFKTGCLLLVLLLEANVLPAQDYHAMQGSNYAGSLGVYNNPASMVNTPSRWDLTLIGLQAKYQTNTVRVMDYSLLSSPANSKFLISGGQNKRYGTAQVNLNLFTARIALGKDRAFAFGLNLRSVANLSSSSYNYRDSISSVSSFLSMNDGNSPYSAKLRGMGVAELALSYGQTVLRGSDWRLNGGLTVKVNRGLAGVQGTIDRVGTSALSGGFPVTRFAGGSLNYGYSAGLDEVQGSKGFGGNASALLRNSSTGLSVDAGLEWLKLPDNGPSYTQTEDQYFDYDWKVSASLLDLGWSQYQYGKESVKGSVPTKGPSVYEVQEQLDTRVTNLETFNDALASLIPLEHNSSAYKIFSPARISLNVDRWVLGALYLNADLNINIGPLFLGKSRYALTSMNVFRFTPRWELRRWGIYLPLQYNAHNQVWVGAAGRIGPLLVGLHNLANIFSKTSMANGGGYIAFRISTVQIRGIKRNRKYDCPAF
ncbi:MAG: DUF5723 family protein [Flavihumibacter sp.]